MWNEGNNISTLMSTKDWFPYSVTEFLQFYEDENELAILTNSVPPDNETSFIWCRYHWMYWSCIPNKSNCFSVCLRLWFLVTTDIWQITSDHAILSLALISSIKSHRTPHSGGYNRSERRKKGNRRVLWRERRQYNETGIQQMLLFFQQN